MAVIDRSVADARRRIPNHPAGLAGMDHVALAARDPDRTARFYVDVLGGSVFRRFEETYGNGQVVPHVFIHMGAVLVQVAFPPDGRSFPDPTNTTPWPHWAFGTSPEGIDAMRACLEKHGVPYDGPRLHKSGSTAIYLKDPEGNKLEVVTWDEYRPDASHPMGTEYGFPDWTKLDHDWKPQPLN